MLTILRNPRVFIAFSHDMLWALFSFWVAFSLRYSVYPWGLPTTALEQALPYSVIVFFINSIVFHFFGLYQGIWRFSSVEDLLRVLKGATTSALFTFIAIFFWNRLENVPRSIFLIQWLLLVMGLGGGRFFYRVWKDNRLHKMHRSLAVSKRVLIVGAGTAGEYLAREIHRNPALNLDVIGFVDDDHLKKERTIHGHKVLGKPEDIPSLVPNYSIDEIYIALPSATGDQIKRIVEYCQKSSAKFKTLPRMNDILSGRIELSLLRNVELEDLLGREAVKLDTTSIGQMIAGKTILVTGAGGSIGSELCRQILRFNPKRLVLFELCELFLYELEMELKRLDLGVEIVAVIGDVRNRARVRSVFQAEKPDLVLHAAAYKHVPMMEAHPGEAIHTNVFGTRIVAEEAVAASISKFVMISTDKAVNPTNVMGTTKRVAEMVCQNLNRQSQGRTQFITVRFGNVLGSNGSVIPLFKKQIERGGPITITHPEITRYFMSIPEASQLVLQAGAMGKGGEIFVLDMGESVKIVDLVKEMVKLSGLTLGEDIQIEFTGLRPGEKLYEELFEESEELVPTEHKKVRVARGRGLPEHFEEMISIMCEGPLLENKIAYMEQLQKLVPEYRPDLNFH